LGRRKRGWKVMAAMSLGDLQRIIEAKESEVARLMERRDDLQAQLDEVDAQIAGSGGEVRRGPGRPRGRRGPGRPPKAGRRGPGRPPKRGPGRPKGKRRGRKAGPKGQSPLHNAIRDALKGASEPMKLADIADKVKSGGYKTKSANFTVILGQRLPEMKDVKKAGRGLYVMK